MSDIIYTPPASGGGGQNPTTNYIPLNNGTSSFVDSSIYNDLANNLLKTSFNSDFGLYLTDDGINRYASLGDYNINYLGAYILVDDTSRYIEINAGRNANVTSLYIDDAVQTITTKTNNQDIGLKLDFANREYFFGDFSGVVSLTYLYFDVSNDYCNLSASPINLIVNGGNQFIKTIFGGNDIGLKLDYTISSFYLGDFDNNLNKTYIWVKDASKSINLLTNGGEITFTADLLQFSGALTSVSAGGSSPLGHLMLTINGTPCKIQLLNP